MSGYKVTCPRRDCLRHRDCWISSGQEPFGAEEREDFLARWAEDVDQFLTNCEECPGAVEDVEIV
jgi:hypothetical protein